MLQLFCTEVGTIVDFRLSIQLGLNVAVSKLTGLGYFGVELLLSLEIN